MNRRMFLMFGVGLLMIGVGFIPAAALSGSGLNLTTSTPTTTPTPTSTPTITETSAPLRDNMLLQDNTLLNTDSACLAPCWHNIMPGETSWEDALTILENDAALENVEVSTDDQSSALVASFQQKGGTSCCQVFTQDGLTVNVIFLRVVPNMTLGQLIGIQGKPSYLVGSPFSDDQAVLNLIYPDKSLVVYIFVAGAKGSLKATSEIIGVLYLTPADMDLLIRTSSLYFWKGYQPFQVYFETAYDVTPSVTLTPTPP